jgi:hypothetical protein
VVDSIRHPQCRAQGYLDLCNALPAGEANERRTLLAQALLHTRAIREADQRVVYLGQVAARFFALGDKDKATEILHEGLESVKGLSTTGGPAYARGAFAECLALMDLPTALGLIKDLNDFQQFDRHVGDIARRLAGINPAEAERVLGMMLNKYAGNPDAARLCYRMAPLDRDRARRIADQSSNILWRAEAYGAMALALVKTDPVAATGFLRQAFDLLAEQSEKGREDFNNLAGSSSLAATLLPVAEAIDPALVPEFFWRAISFRIPRSEDPREAAYPRGWMADAALAYALARYDRQLAGMILDEASPRLLRRLNLGGNRMFEAATMVDPVQGVHLLEELPPENRQDYLWERVATRLLREWRLPLWASNQEDY